MDSQNANISAPWVRLGAPMKMGLRSCSPKDWLLAPDAFGDASMKTRQLALKQALAEQHHAAIFQALPDADEAAQELLALIAANLDRHHQVKLPNADQLQPLDHAARHLPEDLLLLAPEPVDDQSGKTQWVLKAAALAFPSHWVLAEKMGLPMAGIHAPVPHYAEQLARPVDRFFDAMIENTISLRRNWTLQIGDGLFTPKRQPHSALSEADLGERLYVRVERQTLRKMPKTGWIVFTIQTSLAPINRWANDAEALRVLLNLVDEMSPAMRDYRGTDRYGEALKSWVKQAR